MNLGDFLVGVGGEVVDGHDHRQAEAVDVLDVLLEVRQPLSRASTFAGFRSSLATPPCSFSARTVATITTASGLMPALRHLMLKNFSAPRSAPKPASVTVYSESRIASFVASTLLQPWAMLANGPPWMKAGLFSSVCTRFGLRASFKQHGHRAVGLQVGGGDRLAVAGVGRR